MAEQRAQRRLAAILAADVVGYSRLMRADEAGTLAQLKTLRKELLDPKITEYRGRVVKTTGDGILIEFPSAVDAVQHAVEALPVVAWKASGSRECFTARYSYAVPISWDQSAALPSLLAFPWPVPSSGLAILIGHLVGNPTGVVIPQFALTFGRSEPRYLRVSSRRA